VATDLIAQAVVFRVGAPEISAGILGAAMFALAVWALIDAAKYPDKDWAAIGKKKGNWVIAIILANLFCGPIGPIVSIYYLVVIRANLRALHGARF
jgi:hypothetical protein